MEKEVDVAIIGGGPAGLSAAVALKNLGINNIIILERNEDLGGILNQCIHPGFGLILFKEDLTGPEYADRYISEVKKLEIPYSLDTMVIDITPDKKITAVKKNELLKIKAKAIILTMGCRERTRGALQIPGYRCGGIYTAGTSQNFINLKNLMVGKKIVILGSGDIGLIMARRLTLEGAKVEAVVEILPYCSGITRNVVQCLEDYDIPLLLKHTIIDIKGLDRVESVTIAKVDENWKPVEGTEREIECDTLLLSVGLIPENELSKKAGVKIDDITGGAVVNEYMETNVDGIFACGNVLHVHDIVDFVSKEAEKTAEGVVHYLKNDIKGYRIKTKAGSGIRYVMPHSFMPNKDLTLYLRVANPDRDVKICIKDGNRIIKKYSKKRVTPAEMIKIDLKKDQNNISEELVVECIKE